MRKLSLFACVLVLAAASPSPSPKPTPAFVLHRTSAAFHVNSGQPNPVFFLVLGSDVRQGDPRSGRSDSIHIVAVNPASMRGTILGIPRDTWTNVPGRGPDKINAALDSGGPPNVVAAVTALTGIPIHFWAIVEFSRFRELVERLGGLDMNVPYPIVDSFSGSNFTAAGPKHMNGNEALAISRARHGVPGGDLGRSSNQGLVLKAGLAQFRAQTGDPIGLLKYLHNFRGLVATDVPADQLLNLAMLARRLDPNALDNVVMPASLGQVGSQSVVFASPNAPALFADIRDDGMLAR